MADKSQRNQFKKKVTTCPLLLSLFLLGVKSAKTSDPPALYQKTLNAKVWTTAAATVEFYKESTATLTAMSGTGGATSKASDCYTTCKAQGDATKHSVCQYERTFTQTAPAAVTYTATCKLYETLAASAPVYVYPLLDTAPTADIMTTSWVWNLDTAAGDAFTSCATDAILKSRIGVPYIAAATGVTEQPDTGLYELLGRKAVVAGQPAGAVAASATGLQSITALIGVPAVGDTWASDGVYTANTGSAATGLHALIGAPAKVATGNTLTSHKGPVAASGLYSSIGAPAAGQTTLFAAIGAPQQPKLYHTVSGSVVVNDASGADATGLYARIGGPAVASVLATAGTLANGDKAEIPVSGLWEKIGSPAVAATAKHGIDGTATPAAAGTNTASTGLYKHIGDPAAAAIAYAAAAAGKAAVVGKNAIPASGMYKSIADKAVTSCPTEAQIKEVIKTTEPKAPADGAEARFAATLLASAAALAALV